MTNALHSIYTYGALRVIVEDHSGAILAVQCRIDGASAEGRYRHAYVQAAIAYAVRQHSATYAGD